MAQGVVAGRVLSDIANAIRKKRGYGPMFPPSSMAMLIKSLPESPRGTGDVFDYNGPVAGLVSEETLTSIADAIRTASGSTDRYRPGEMAAAILAIDKGQKLRALLLSDGTLEINYLGQRKACSGSGKVVEAWSLPTTTFESAEERPWHSVAARIRRVWIDSSLEKIYIPSISYWFCDCPLLEEVVGFDNLGATDKARMAFSNCPSLHTIWAKSFDGSNMSDVTSAFHGCHALVGGGLAVADDPATKAMFSVGGKEGLLTDPDADERRWVHVYYYPINSHEVDAAYEAIVDAVDTTKYDAISMDGLWIKAVGNARYKEASGLPWHDLRPHIKSFTFYQTMDGFEGLCLDHWFEDCTKEDFLVMGWEHAHVRSLRFSFAGCTGSTTLSLHGLDPSGIADWSFAFSRMTSLVTAEVDPGWALPAGLTDAASLGTFLGDVKLVGGAGTAYDASRTTAAMAVVDGDGGEGYLTAAKAYL